MWELTITPRKTKRPRRLVPGRRPDVSSWTRHSGCDAFARLRHHGAQLLAGLEDRHRSRGNFHRVTGTWIARHASLALANLERAKPANLNVMLLGQRRFDRVEEGVNYAGAVLFGNQGTGGASDLCGDLFDQVGLRHPSPLKGPRAVKTRGQHTGLPIVCQELGGTVGSGLGRNAVPARPPDDIARRKSGIPGASPLRRCRR